MNVSCGCYCFIMVSAQYCLLLLLLLLVVVVLDSISLQNMKGRLIDLTFTECLQSFYYRKTMSD